MPVPQKVRFVIKRHATRPYLRLLVKDLDDNAFDFTDATGVTFVMKDSDDAVVVSGAGDFESDPTSGVLRYQWAAGDTDVEGEYQAEFDVGYPGDGLLTLPLDGNITVRIYEDVNDE